MESASHDQVTRLLLRWRQGDMAAMDALLPLVESELRRLAGGYMRNERPGHTLQPTALVNEAWLRMAQQNQPEWEGRSHFISIAARYMRQILVDYARGRNAGKRGPGLMMAGIESPDLLASEGVPDLVALDDGLNELAQLDPRQAQIVELHFFGGLTYDEIAAFLNIGRSTVVRDLRMARVWLKNYLQK